MLVKCQTIEIKRNELVSNDFMDPEVNRHRISKFLCLYFLYSQQQTRIVVFRNYNNCMLSVVESLLESVYEFV